MPTQELDDACNFTGCPHERTILPQLAALTPTIGRIYRSVDHGSHGDSCRRRDHEVQPKRRTTSFGQTSLGELQHAKNAATTLWESTSEGLRPRICFLMGHLFDFVRTCYTNGVYSVDSDMIIDVLSGCGVRNAQSLPKLPGR